MADTKGNIEEENSYYPYGMLMASNYMSVQPYKYSGKELDTTHGIHWLDYGARMSDVALGRWHSMDRMCEKYYDVSPYAMCCNNPMLFVDLKGEYVAIWYQDRRGNDRCFVYNGTQGKMPNNQFVKDFVYTYLFLRGKGAGENLVKAVTNSDILINVQETKYASHAQQDSRRATVFWNPRRGIVTSRGGKQSPATILDHEFDHCLDAMKNNWRNYSEHQKRNGTYNSNYENEEEKRVITGSERKNVKILKESIRFDHNGELYDVESPISTTPKKRK